MAPSLNCSLARATKPPRAQKAGLYLGFADRRALESRQRDLPRLRASVRAARARLGTRTRRANRARRRPAGADAAWRDRLRQKAIRARTKERGTSWRFIPWVEVCFRKGR